MTRIILCFITLCLAAHPIHADSFDAQRWSDNMTREQEAKNRQRQLREEMDRQHQDNLEQLREIQEQQSRIGRDLERPSSSDEPLRPAANFPTNWTNQQRQKFFFAVYGDWSDSLRSRLAGKAGNLASPVDTGNPVADEIARLIVAERALLGEDQSEEWRATVESSKARAIKYYPFVEDPDSPQSKRMLEIDQELKERGDPLYWSAEKPFILAAMAAAEKVN